MKRWQGTGLSLICEGEQEARRIPGNAINQCRLGQLALHGAPSPSYNPPMIKEKKDKGAVAEKSGGI